MHVLHPLIRVLLAAGVISSAAFSQTYPFKAYTTADGLAQSAISCFFQDSRGYMWFGTWGGISRYDGSKFWSYRSSTFRVTSICEDSKHNLWIGAAAGLARLARPDSSLQWTRFSDGGLPSDYVVGLVKDGQGNIWVGTVKGLVVFTNSGRRIVFNSQNGLQDDNISGLKEDSTGAILIGSGKGIMRCRLKDSNLVSSEELLKGTIAGAMIVLRNGDILVNSVPDQTVLRFTQGEWQIVFSTKALGPSVHVRSLGEDNQGKLWIGTTLGLFTVESGKSSSISTSRGLPNQYIGAMYRDREGVMWFGTEGGALKLPGTAFRSYNYSLGLPGDHVISIFRDEKKNCWFGTYNGVAMLDPAGRITVFGLNEGLPHLSVHSFAQGKNGNIWIGSWDGLMVHENGKLISGPVQQFRYGPVIRLVHDRHGNIWCGGRGKIVKVTPDGKVALSLGANEGIPKADISSVFIDAEENLWFGTDSHGGGVYRDGRMVRLGEADGLPDPWVMSISQDKRGTIWFGTQHGAVFWNGKRFQPIHTSDEELRNGIISFVVQDSARHMWFGTQRGVYEWDDSLINHLDNYDGLIADPTRCGYVDKEGNLWIGTVGGVSHLEMRTFSRKEGAPPIHIEGLTLDEQTLPEIRSSFSYDENTLTIHFNSLSFRDERRMEFQWILAGFDATWQPPQTERHVRYTHLPWGKYQFIVRARNQRTAWSEPAQLAFAIYPPFWGTWWFLALSIAIVAGSLLLVYQRRVKSLEKEKLAGQKFSRQLMESQESERKRIAGELHDSLVQNLLVAKNRSLLGMKKASDPGGVERELLEISNVLTDAIDEVREIAHNLRPYQLDRLGLTQALLSLAEKMSESSTTKFSTDIDNIDSLFTADTSTILYRIVQESVNNILKHSGASVASISVKWNPPSVDIIVRDNGRGFRDDQSLVPHTHGFGLSGIEQRVKMLGGALTIDSAANVGTTISITIPIQTKHP